MCFVVKLSSDISNPGTDLFGEKKYVCGLNYNPDTKLYDKIQSGYTLRDISHFQCFI